MIMKKKHLFSFVLCLLSLFMIMSGCSQDRQSHDSLELTDTSKKLNVTEFPNNGVSIGQHTKLVFSFNKPVDISSVVISGTLYSECNGGTWSSVKFTNDTLTVKPANRWSTGSEKTITINANNALGELAEFAYTYTVINQVIYVRPSGHDYSPGSLTQPKQTIQAAIQQAAESEEVTEIHVAQGTYAVNYQQGTDIKIHDGILLYGGYSPVNWDERNTALYETIIKDYSMAGENNSPVTFSETTSGFAVIDGFTIAAGSGITSSGIKINTAAAKVSNNKIVLGSAWDKNYGIYVNGNISPQIENNTITGSNRKWMYGIYNNGSNTRIVGNTITLSNGEDFTTPIHGIYNVDTPEIGQTISGNTMTLKNKSGVIDAIYCSNTAATISNNIIRIESQSGCDVLHTQKASLAVVNNVFDLLLAESSTVLSNNSTDGVSGILYNNTIAADDSADNSCRLIYAYYSSSTYYFPDVIISNNILSGITTFSNTYVSTMVNKLDLSNNIVDVAFSLSSYIYNYNTPIPVTFADYDNHDFHLVDISSVNITEAGLDGDALGWLFNYDIEGIIRTGNGTNGWSMGAYELDNATGTDFPADMYENDDTFEFPSTITAGETQQRTLHMVDDADIVTFNVPAECDGFTYSISTSDELSYFYRNIELYDNNMQLIESGESVYIQGLPMGDYFIRITSDTVSGIYELSMSFPGDPYEYNNYSSDATEIAMNSSFNASLVGTDIDYYTFSLDTPHNISVSQTNVSTDLNIRFTLYVYEDRGDGYQYYTAASVNDTATGPESLAMEIPQGTYFVKVDSVNNINGTYTFVLTGTDLVPADNFEPNNSYTGATDILMGSTHNVTLTPADADYYRFETTVVQDVTITVSNLHYGLDIDMHILNSGGALITNVNDNDTNGDETITLTLYPGTYYIFAKREGETVGTYTLNLSGVNLIDPDSFESNNDFTEATPLVTGASVTASLLPGDIDYYSFEISNVYEIGVNITDLTYQLNAVIYIYDAEFNQVAYVNDSGAGVPESLVQTLYPGKYYIVIDKYNNSMGTYSLGLQGTELVVADMYESNNDYTAATSIPIDTDISASLLSDDVDYFTFTLSEANEIEIRVFDVMYGLDASIELLDENFEQIALINDYGINENETYTQNLTAGTYYVAVDNVDSSFGNYTLRIKSYEPMPSETKTGDIGTVTGGSMSLDFTIPNYAVSYTITIEMRGDMSATSEYAAVTIGSVSLGNLSSDADDSVFVTVLSDYDITGCGSPGETVTLTAAFTSEVNFAPTGMSSYGEVRATINYTY